MKSIIIIGLILFCGITSAQSFSGPFGFESRCDVDGHQKALSEIESELLETSDQVSEASLAEAASFADVLVVGEMHIESAAKTVIADSLQALHAQGFRTLALEMLNQSAQEPASLYCEGKMSREEFTEVWKNNWSYPSRRESYLDMVEQACDLGFELLALDIRDQQDLRESEYERMEARNYAMAGKIVRHRELVKGKVLTLVGALHSYFRPLLKSGVHLGELARTTVPTFLSELQPELKVSTALVASRVSMAERTELCLERSTFGFLNEIAPNAPKALALRAPSFVPVDFLIFQDSDAPEFN